MHPILSVSGWTAQDTRSYVGTTVAPRWRKASLSVTSPVHRRSERRYLHFPRSDERHEASESKASERAERQLVERSPIWWHRRACDLMFFCCNTSGFIPTESVMKSEEKLFPWLFIRLNSCFHHTVQHEDGQ